MKLILIDFDDTITNNLDADFFSFTEATGELGLKTSFSIGDIKKLRKDGKLSREIISALVNQHDDRMKEVFHEAREKILNSNEFINRIKLNKGVKDTLRYLQNKGFTTAIVTFRLDRGLIDRFLKKHGIFQYIDNIFLREKTGENIAEAKKSLYLKAINYYGVGKGDVTVIGNLVEDISPAQELGIRCIGVESNYSRREDLDKYGQVISNIKELADIL